MTDTGSSQIKEIFRNLDIWRNLPGFRLEPHVAPFFGLFLADILNESKHATQVHSTVIPEFPLRKGTFESLFSNDKDQNGSKKVDYLAVTENLKKAYLVELKTDSNSIDDDQLKYLKEAERIGVPKFIEGIFDLASASDEKKKYVHLLHQLREICVIGDMPEVYTKAFAHCLKHQGVAPGWSNAMDGVRRSAINLNKTKTQIIFILPNKCVEKKLMNNKNEDSSCPKFIYFKDVAKIVRKKGEVGKVFAKYLCEWQHSKAGSRDPRCPNE